MELNITDFTDDIKNVSIGKIKQNFVEQILERKPEFQGRISSETDILFWKSRIKHTQRHKKIFLVMKFLKNVCVKFQ